MITEPENLLLLTKENLLLTADVHRPKSQAALFYNNVSLVI